MTKAASGWANTMRPAARLQQIVWLGNIPVGMLAGSGGNQKLHYIEADALGTPRVVVDPTRGTLGTAVWRWDLTGQAFGNAVPNQDPDGDDIAFVFDMRFPGQRYDSVSGLSYNYFRYYDASIGRYMQSDPIGLQGGISTFSYALQNPLVSVDPTGEAPLIAPILLNAWLRAIAGCLAVRMAYKEIQKYCRKCKEDCDLENAAANCWCGSAVYSLRKKYIFYRCDYILPGSLMRCPRTAIRGHAIQLLDVKRARNRCCMKAGREIINDFFDRGN
jgi:RHS repeat-associated protein